MNKKEKLHKAVDEVYALAKTMEKDPKETVTNKDIGNELKHRLTEIHQLISQIED